MTVVDDKLLRGERTHTVPQQNVRLVRMFLLRDDAKRNHVFDELIKTAGAEFTKTARGFCGQPMTSVIVSVNDKPVTNQDVGKLAIASDVLTKSVRDLNDAANRVMTAPFHARNGEAVVSCKLEPLRRNHYIYGPATARSWRAQAASRRTRFRILPEPLLGSSVSENSMLRGTLKLASESLQYAVNSSALSVFPGLRTTQAFTISPHFGSGIPKTATSRTAGCV